PRRAGDRGAEPGARVLALDRPRAPRLTRFAARPPAALQRLTSHGSPGRRWRTVQRIGDPTMSAIWTLARKELRLLVRDPRVSIILVAMPLLFILLLGQLLGENFGQPADDRLRVSVVDLDEGRCELVDTSDKEWSPAAGAAVTAAMSLKYRTWSQVVIRDLA